MSSQDLIEAACRAAGGETWMAWQRFKNAAGEPGRAAAEIRYDELPGSMADIEASPAEKSVAFQYLDEKVAKGMQGFYDAFGIPSPQQTRSQKLAAAGYTPRDTRIPCDDCSTLCTPQMLPAHKCGPQPAATSDDAQYNSQQLEEIRLAVANVCGPATGWRVYELLNQFNGVAMKKGKT